MKKSGIYIILLMTSFFITAAELAYLSVVSAPDIAAKNAYVSAVKDNSFSFFREDVFFASDPHIMADGKQR